MKQIFLGIAILVSTSVFCAVPVESGQTETQALDETVQAVYDYQQGQVTQLTLSEVEQITENRLLHALRDGLLRRAGFVKPSALDQAIFTRCFHMLTIPDFFQLAESCSSLLCQVDVLVRLAHNEMYMPIFEKLYELLPDALTAKVFVRYVLMVYGREQINDMPEYVEFCKKFLSVFVVPRCFAPLLRKDLLNALAHSLEVSDLVLLKKMVDPAVSGIATIRALCPFMPELVAILAQKAADRRDAFRMRTMSEDERRAMVLSLAIIISIGKANEVCKDIYPWKAIFTESVAGWLYDLCRAAPFILGSPELELPSVAGKYAGLIKMVSRNFAIKKVVKQMQIEESKKALLSE